MGLYLQMTCRLHRQKTDRQVGNTNMHIAYWHNHIPPMTLVALEVSIPHLNLIIHQGIEFSRTGSPYHGVGRSGWREVVGRGVPQPPLIPPG